MFSLSQKWSRIIRSMLPKTLLLAGLVFVSTSVHAMDVYLFRGLAGIPFSVGLDDLEKKISASGIHAETYPHGRWQSVYRKIMRRGTKNVALIGHSMGALSALSLTEKLKGSGIQVSYLGLIDIPGYGKSAPINAPWSESYVSSQPGFSLLRRKPTDRNLVVNTRVRKTVHITIDDSPKVHDAIVSALWLADARIGNPMANTHALVGKPQSTHKGLDLIETGSTR